MKPNKIATKRLQTFDGTIIRNSALEIKYFKKNHTFQLTVNTIFQQKKHTFSTIKWKTWFKIAPLLGAIWYIQLHFTFSLTENSHSNKFQIVLLITPPPNVFFSVNFKFNIWWYIYNKKVIQMKHIKIKMLKEESWLPPHRVFF